MSTDHFHKQMGQSVGAKLRAARQAKRYTQSQLALPDFSVSYISAIERGQIHPSLRALEILAQRLGLSSADFLPENGQALSRNDFTLDTSPSEEEIAALTFIEAQIAILADNPSEALDLLHTLAVGHLTKSQKLHYSYLLGWAYLVNEQVQEAISSLDDAKKLAVEQKDSYTHSRIHHLLGLAYAAMHNYARVLQCYESCLALLEKAQPPDPFFLCQVYSHLGQHYLQMEDTASAVEMFRQALASAEQVQEMEQKQPRYWEISRHHAQANNYHLAALYAHKSVYLYQQQTHTALRAELYHYLGQAILKQDQEQARTYLEEELQKESNRHDLLAQTSLAIRLAEWSLVHNELDEATRLAQEASHLAQAAGGDSLIAVDTYLVTGRISYAQGRYAEGDSCFEEGLQMLERLQVYDELSDQAAAYAQLLDERNKPQEAIAYYRRAIESRKKRGR